MRKSGTTTPKARVFTADEATERERLDLLSLGCQQITLTQYDATLRSIGYRLDPSMACRCRARYMTGPRAGETFAAMSLHAVQVDDGVSYANVNARRDHNFEALRQLRRDNFAVSRGHIATL